MRGAIGLCVAAVALALSSCSHEPGVQASGGDAYTVIGRAPNSDAGVLIAQNAALENARAFCAAEGRRFRQLGDHLDQSALGGEVTFAVRFRCPSPGSPEIERPTVNQAPDLF